MKQNIFAFWETCEFPHFDGAEVEFFDDNGTVAVCGNNREMFCPLVIVPEYKGLELKKQLRELAKEYHEAKNDVENIFDDAVKKLMNLK